ncbi:hypothetical protein SLA2020_438180 [Shorea laevis]
MVLLDKSLATAMNAKIVGSGSEVIVLAHGFGADQSVWDKILPYLAQHYRVLVFDWTFSGAVEDQSLFDPLKYSSYDAFANDLIALLDEMNLQSLVFVGHSMSASPRYINTDDYEGGFEKSGIEQIISSVESDYENWATGFASIAVDTTDPVSVEKFAKCLKRMRPEVALPLAKTVFYSDERDLLDKVTTPCTIIQTTNDVVVPNSVASYMQNKIKGKSTVEIIDGDGHFPQLTAHLRLLDVLRSVLGFDIVGHS